MTCPSGALLSELASKCFAQSGVLGDELGFPGAQRFEALAQRFGTRPFGDRPAGGLWR
jgi:hypothetical protein